MTDTALLLMSELVTNAIRASTGHSGRDHGKLPMIGIAARLTATNLVLEVWDKSPLRPVYQKADPVADHGRGLTLVDALADSWGDSAAYDGKVVWCELAIPRLSASASNAS